MSMSWVGAGGDTMFIPEPETEIDFGVTVGRLMKQLAWGRPMV